jgi:BspA type Leucine rich repeat region (6 copies)
VLRHSSSGDTGRNQIYSRVKITSIGDSAFSSCYNVTSFSFPASLNSSSTGIAASAFFNCYNVLDYYFYSTTVPSLANTNAFSLINPFCKIHVPAASLATYKTATNWSTYANYIVGDL